MSTILLLIPITCRTWGKERGGGKKHQENLENYQFLHYSFSVDTDSEA